MGRIKPLFTATATAIGGRNGHTESNDGLVKADLSIPKAIGGPGKPGMATPEHLFAAGYTACFGGSLDFVAKQNEERHAYSKGNMRGNDRRARGRWFWAGAEDARRG